MTMSLEIFANHKTTFLFPVALEEFLPKDHPARFIRAFIESLDLKALGFTRRIATQGRPSYSADIMLSIWLYGFFMKMRSSRNLEKACMDSLGLMWLTGMNYPDHNTIWRFFRKNRKAIKKVFKQSVQLASSMGLVGMALHAVDGTKVRADVSNQKALHRGNLQAKLDQIDTVIAEIIGRIESNETQDHGKEYKLPDEFVDKLEDQRALRDEITRKLDQLDASGLNHQSPVDDEARMMRNGKGSDFCYNAQAAVDDQNGVIVGTDVVSEASDNFVLGSMLDTVEDTMGKTADETVADGGFFSGQTLHDADEKSRNVLINIPDNAYDHQIQRSSEFHHSRFIYHSDGDFYECPKGGTLSFRRIKTNRRKSYAVRQYRCINYRDCPFRDQCSRDSRGRTLEQSPYSEVVERQRMKQSSDTNKALLSKRKAIVEPVFGIIKHNWGFRRWTVRGLENVKAQWSMICTTYNLMKLYNHWVKSGTFMPQKA
jgi:transposase